jgi:prolyl oligopeptidase
MTTDDLILAGLYPDAPRSDVVEDVAGVRIVDPYRWLEAETEDVHAWQAAQAELATATIAATGTLPCARLLIEEYGADARPALPRRGGDRWFRAVSGPEGAALVAADSPYGEGRVLVDLREFEDEDGAAVASWLAPSPDGAVLAFGVCTDGS